MHDFEATRVQSRAQKCRHAIPLFMNGMEIETGERGNAVSFRCTHTLAVVPKHQGAMWQRGVLEVHIAIG